MTMYFLNATLRLTATLSFSFDKKAILWTPNIFDSPFYVIRYSKCGRKLFYSSKLYILKSPRVLSASYALSLTHAASKGTLGATVIAGNCMSVAQAQSGGEPRASEGDLC
jgi:hypothetical protein